MSENKSTPSVHAGHRDRIKTRFLANRGNDFADHELLEMLLFYTLPRVNTNPLAHMLIDEFGSLEDVLNADPERLERIQGLGKSTSLLFSLLFAIKKRTDMQKYKNTKFTADSLTKVGNYFVDYFKGKKYEEVCVLLLDNSLKLIGFKSLSSGSINSTKVDIRELTKYALTNDASYVIMAHNHPSGLLIASAHDKNLTYNIESALYAVGIVLMEHIITNDVAFTPTMQGAPRRYTTESSPAMMKNFYKN